MMAVLLPGRAICGVTMIVVIAMIVLVHGHMVVSSKIAAANPSRRSNLRIGAQEKDDSYQKLDCQLPRASEIYLRECHPESYE